MNIDDDKRVLACLLQLLLLLYGSCHVLDLLLSSAAKPQTHTLSLSLPLTAIPFSLLCDYFLFAFSLFRFVDLLIFFPSYYAWYKNRDLFT